MYAQMYNKRQKSILKPILKAQQRIERMSKKRAHKCISDPGTSPDGPVPNGITLAVEEMQQASPSRSRSRKSRHRRNNSRGSKDFPNNSGGYLFTDLTQASCWLSCICNSCKSTLLMCKLFKSTYDRWMTDG